MTDDLRELQRLGQEIDRMTNPTPAEIINDTVWAGRRLNAGHQVVEALNAAGYEIKARADLQAMQSAIQSLRQMNAYHAKQVDKILEELDYPMLNTKDTGS